MRHLSNDELLALAEGAGEGASHLESCAACRGHVHELREVLVSVREEEMPEPSPLFWTHFSERVKRAVAVEPEPASSWPSRVGLLRPIAAVAALAAVALMLFVIRTGMPSGSDQDTSRSPMAADSRGVGPGERSAPDPTADTAMSEPAGSDVGDVLNGEASWMVVADLAGDLDLDSAGEAGLIIRPGSAERAAGQLSEEERRLVVEFLREELLRPKL